MADEQKLIEAIQSKKAVLYQYNKPGKTPGQRVGNPYVVFNMPLKDGSRNKKLHIVQTEGVTDSGDRQPLPSFRTHDIGWVTNVEIIEDSEFAPDHPDYNPNWEKYDDIIAQV